MKNHRDHLLPNSLSSFITHALSAFVCCWLAACTALGILYRDDASITDFTWLHTLVFLIAFTTYELLLYTLVHIGKTSHLPTRLSHAIVFRFFHRAQNCELTSTGSKGWISRLYQAYDSCKNARRIICRTIRRVIFRLTYRRRNIMLTLLIAWLWVPLTLLAAFGADINSQIREYSWAWNQFTGLRQPYIGFFSFVPMDIYPTAHYLWPSNPTYLTDQHNIVLTVIYGAFAAISRYFTGVNDAGIILLSLLQYVFAAWCCTASLHRFFNKPWLQTTRQTAGYSPGPNSDNTQFTSARMRGFLLLFFIANPLVIFSTIALTKSPLFAFAFLWWFGIGYELHSTRKLTLSCQTHANTCCAPVTYHTRRHTLIELFIATCIMLISAKYAWYLLIIQCLLLLFADRKRWRIWCTCLLLPTLVLHGTLLLLIGTGKIISGDPIESRGVQLQQIARIVSRDPQSIPKKAKRAIAPIFNLDQTAKAYKPYDADPVKSSGLQSKRVSYRWRYVTKHEIQQFNQAWWLMVKHSPIIATDALLAKCYGYFDIADTPYVGIEYYINTNHVQKSAWIGYWLPQWRANVANSVKTWSTTPIVGWIMHGNLYVIIILLIGVAEILLKRWHTVVWHMPFALLMGVMMLAPANNFERHMLPLTFSAIMVALTFWRETLDSTAQISSSK